MKNILKASAFVGVCALALQGAALANPDDDKAAVKATLEAASSAWLKCDLDAAAKYDAEGRTGYYPDSSAVQTDTEENRKKEADFCANGGAHELTYAVKDVIIYGDVAVAYGDGHYKRTEPGGAVSIDSDYTFTDVLVKSKGGWKFKHSHVGVVMPMEDAATASADQ